MTEPTVTIEFETGNAAFDDPSEVERILAVAAREIASGLEILRMDLNGPGSPVGCGGAIADVNGNTVGTWSVSGAERNDPY